MSMVRRKELRRGVKVAAIPLCHSGSHRVVKPLVLLQQILDAWNVFIPLLPLLLEAGQAAARHIAKIIVGRPGGDHAQGAAASPCFEPSPQPAL